ncbi:hypothetical protein DVJ83_08760 [Deinococcus wulumuqiensis]|uniref:Uncharacterized protein n=1 Tax=Deinococcus wulumuqiensis TaxID=980427 RepID=A0A345IHQ3_9DEIO|nr:hypothetical protein [Deinococcus wulumuqiensis]AXG99225.1 hypothetical protein DVJ83_08760 [Deinococcus wulumuqiensis]
MSSERTDPITALAQLQAEAAALQGGPPEAESAVPGQVSIVFDDLPLPPRRDAEVPPPDPALLREQLQADLLREQLAHNRSKPSTSATAADSCTRSKTTSASTGASIRAASSG